MKTKQHTGAFLSKNAVSWIVYCVMALVLALLQAAPNAFPEIGFARPLPLVLFVVCVALFEGVRIGAGVGLLSGLLWDLFTFHLFGFDALILMLLGMTVGLLVQWLLRANFLSAMLLSVGGVLIQAILEWLFCYAIFEAAEAWAILGKVYLPNALYTVLLAPLMYWLVFAVARFLRRRTNG